jgi:hypothetical protein
MIVSSRQCLLGLFPRGDVLRHKMDKAESEFTLTVYGVPAKRGIVPWNKLVDRSPGDNTTSLHPM